VLSQRDLPIGVFDSGVGGLTVVRALREHLPSEDILYLGDTARVPYGTRSPATVDRYAQRVAGHLVRRGIKALVVACNTATTYALEGLTAAGRRRGIPVIGVISPGVSAAIQTSAGHIGIIGTEGTIRGGAYTRQLAEAAPTLKVSAVACPLFVSLAEEGWTDGDIAKAVAARYLEPLKTGPDTLILGCTHYPLLASAIAAALPGVKLVDSASSTAKAVAQTLADHGLLSDEASGTSRFLVTDNKDRFIEVGTRFLGAPPLPTELIDLDDKDQAAWATEASA
jgi:glutamate racemase